MDQAQRLEQRNCKLEAFLYILLRDHITLGACESLMRDAKKASDQGATFSNEHLHAYLEELMERIR